MSMSFASNPAWSRASIVARALLASQTVPTTRFVGYAMKSLRSVPGAFMAVIPVQRFVKFYVRRGVLDVLAAQVVVEQAFQSPRVCSYAAWLRLSRASPAEADRAVCRSPRDARLTLVRVRG